MKLKLDENGNVVLQDGKPVYVHDDGKEVAFDAPATVATITRLNAEAKNHREAKETAEKALKAFDGIEDPKAAVRALETISNLDQKKLIDAGEVEKVKAEISKAFQGQLDEANSKAQTLEQQLYSEKIGGSFARSKFISEKLVIPADMVQATFGKNLKVEEGKVVAYDSHGQKIFSDARPGELADFDEAIAKLVDQYPHKNSILKGPQANGGGAASNGGLSGNQKTMTRAQFEALAPAERMSAIKTTQITD